MPIFNVENLLERALNSIINQTMDLSDIEVIMVDDCSTDNSRKIMEKYSKKYANFISLYHEENSGGCGFPRNTGLEVASGEYVLFLDADDEYMLDNCEILYKTIKKYDADIAFGRYMRVFPHLNKFEVSFSPYLDNLSNEYKNIKLDNCKNISKLSKLRSILNDYIIYGKKTQTDSSYRDIVHVDNLEQDFDLLMLPPAVWTKLYRRDFLLDNQFIFQQEAAEDIVFVMGTFLKAEGIVFLNNFIGHKYYKYESAENESMTNVVSYKLLSEVSNSYIFCSKYCCNFPKYVRNFLANSFLTSIYFLWCESNLDKIENNHIIDNLNTIRKKYDVGFKSNLLFLLRIFMINISNYFR